MPRPNSAQRRLIDIPLRLLNHSSESLWSTVMAKENFFMLPLSASLLIIPLVQWDDLVSQEFAWGAPDWFCDTHSLPPSRKGLGRKAAESPWVWPILLPQVKPPRKRHAFQLVLVNFSWVVRCFQPGFDSEFLCASVSFSYWMERIQVATLEG